MATYVIDTNVVFNAFLDDELFTKILASEHSFHAPRKLESELAGLQGKIKKLGKMSDKAFDGHWTQLKTKISLKDPPRPKVQQAESILREVVHHLEDKEFFGLALYLNCALWTKEREYWQGTKQNRNVPQQLREKGLIAVSDV